VSDPFRRVRAGTKLEISASAWNDAAKLTSEKKRQGERPLPIVPHEPVPERFDMLVLNPSDGSVPNVSLSEMTFEPYQPIAVVVPRFPPLTDDDLSLAEFDRKKVMVGVPPAQAAAGFVSTAYAIPLEPIEPGRIGRACFRGLTLAKVTAEDDAQYVSVDTSPTSPTFRKLIGGAGPFRVLWKDPDVNPNEERMAFVCMGDTRRYFAWAYFDATFYQSSPGSREATLFDRPGPGGLNLGDADVVIAFPMVYLGNTGGGYYLTVINEDGSYTVVDKGLMLVEGNYTGSASSGQIAFGSVNVNVIANGLGDLTDGAYTIAVSGGGSYVVVAQGCPDA
jgi:hypothetical protein